MLYLIGGLLIVAGFVVIAFVLWNVIERFKRKPKR